MSLVDEPIFHDLNLVIAPRKQAECVPNTPISKFASVQRLSSWNKPFITATDSITIPNSIDEALENRNWVQTVKMVALKKNNRWEVMSLPKGKKSVGGKMTLHPQVQGRLGKARERTREGTRQDWVSKGVYPDLWGWLLGDVCTCSQNEHCTSITVSCSYFLLTSVLCEECFPRCWYEEVFMEPPPHFDKNFGSIRFVDLKRPCMA